MSNFSGDLVKKIAKLARIKVSEEEVISYANNLSAILQEVEKLQEIDTTNIKPLSNVTLSPMRLREDVISDGNCVEDVLTNAKDAQYNCYIVPKVIE